MRPRTLEEYIGQQHLLAPGRLLRRAIEADRIRSMILYGPPGTGKTTLARVIAERSRSTFVSLNATLSGVKALREEVEAAQRRRERFDQATLLFIDEIHRFNQAQQDALLPWVERGVVTLIGATTENPYFEVNAALNSRSHIFQLAPLSDDELRSVVTQALEDPRGYAHLSVELDGRALNHWVGVVNGDARSLLNALELAVETTEPDEGIIRVDLEVAEASIQERAVLYDRDGDAHFDVMSAFIKSLRGSDADASLYWLAQMIYAGEPARTIFRRLLIFASEDVGLAWPSGVSVIEGCAAAFERVGMPEGRFHLSHATLALATAPKSNSTLALFDALKEVAEGPRAEVPLHLRDPSRDGEALGHGVGYVYPHAYREHWVAQDYLPEALKGRVFYTPSRQGEEALIHARVRALREAQLEGVISPSAQDPLLSLPPSVPHPSAPHPSAQRASLRSPSPHERSLARWVERAMGDASVEFARLRDAALKRARPRRSDRALDLNAGGGLISWPLTREAVEGGVWSWCLERREAEAMIARSRELDWAHRPQVMWGELSEDLRELGDRSELGDVPFDLVMGRSLLGAPSQWDARISSITRLIGDYGRVVLMERDPEHTDRLSGAVSRHLNERGVTLGSSIVEAWRAAESRAYEQRGLGWSADQLSARLLMVSGCTPEEIIVERVGAQRAVRIDSERAKRWLSDHAESYINRLRPSEGSEAGLSTLELSEVRRAIERVTGDSLSWRVSWLVLSVRCVYSREP